MAHQPEPDGRRSSTDVWELPSAVQGWGQLSKSVLWKLLPRHRQLCTGLQGQTSGVIGQGSTVRICSLESTSKTDNCVQHYRLQWL